MIKSIIFACLMLGTFLQVNAQHKKKMDSTHKIVFQLSNEDTLVHNSLLKQLNNVLTAAPTAQLEVVCHGPGINMLLKDKTTVQNKISELVTKGVVFVACENTLREKNISKDQIIVQAGFVPSAIVEIAIKQEQGWSYIKAGF